ncbi:hypothetical protein QA802_36900 [Streptomyces sp. B21-105]|uniref:hypothetical protein n=1 Tax=Streptomyces sp. B21-105 TaxID=3039417 RepID=UPI002FEF9515
MARFPHRPRVDVRDHEQGHIGQQSKYAAELDAVADAKSVFDVCQYPEGRSLRGFTKPVTRITGLLRSLGKIPESAVRVLKAEYDAGPGPASGFSVHPLLVPLVNELGDEDES